MVWLLLGRVLHMASVASLVCAVALPVLVWASGRESWEIGLAAALAALIVARHAKNLSRLARGGELRI